LIDRKNVSIYHKTQTILLDDVAAIIFLENCQFIFYLPHKFSFAILIITKHIRYLDVIYIFDYSLINLFINQVSLGLCTIFLLENC